MDIASTSVAVPTLTNTAPSIAAQTSVKSQAVTFAHTAKEISKEDAKSTKKDAKEIIKAIKKEQKKQGSNTDLVLLVILALFIPPLAVYLYEGYWTERCTINLILTLLCGLPGVIHALIVILGNR
ncbi:MAG: YqaE/Pmp3 family membrane protein [Crocinitomicaceae bacterium]|nr:YqaE/Pmp3 family membrane protein [Crocinitomicaceae bacterium]